VSDHDADLARMRAEIDQAREGLKELAGVLSAFYRELFASGFTKDQALDLTKTWLLHMLGSASASQTLEQLFEHLGGEDDS